MTSMLNFRGLSMPSRPHIIRYLFVLTRPSETHVFAPIPQMTVSDFLLTGRSLGPAGRTHSIPLHCSVSSVIHQRGRACDVRLQRRLNPEPESKVIIHLWSHFSTIYITRQQRLLCPSLGPTHPDNYKGKPCISVMRWLEIKPRHHFPHNAPG